MNNIHLKITENNFLFKIIILFIIQIILLISFLYRLYHLKIALCTMAKSENLYINEFIEYYINLGINRIFIYDDNALSKEKVKNVINRSNRNIIIVDNIKKNIKYQWDALTDCYQKNKKNYNWFLMMDIDEYLIIVNNTLSNYLLNPIFKKCDFIKVHWLIASDNNLLHYDNRSLFKRFPGPYKKSKYIKSIIRGNIDELKFWIHSPYISPKKNTTCNNIGKVINYNNIGFQVIKTINVEKAYIIHFYYKSTEEFINKYKRGYRWYGKHSRFMISKIFRYFIDNKITKEKIDYIEKELKFNLSNIKKRINKL